MEKQQKLVTDNRRVYFESRVNLLIQEGWRMVPNTLSVSFSYHSDSPDDEVLMVIMEK